MIRRTVYSVLAGQSVTVRVPAGHVRVHARLQTTGGTASVTASSSGWTALVGLTTTNAWTIWDGDGLGAALVVAVSLGGQPVTVIVDQWCDDA